jgi:hypothetical protein
MRESSSLLSFGLNGAFAPILKHSNDLKYQKIMTEALLLYALFDIRAKQSSFGYTTFHPDMPLVATPVYELKPQNFPQPAL